jgi:hypothetical protein
MRKMLTLNLFCLAILLPGAAPAKKPQDQPPVECVVLIADGLQDGIYTNSPFTVKVNRVPGYPGSWHNPEVAITVSYPGNGDKITYETTIHRWNVTYFKHTFVVPDLMLPDGGEAVIDAVVREQLVRGKKVSYQETTCSRSVPVIVTSP